MPINDERSKQMNSFAKPDFDISQAKEELEKRFDAMSRSIEQVKKAREVDERDLRMRFRG